MVVKLGECLDPCLPSLTALIIVLLGIIDCLEETGLRFEGVIGCGVSEVMAAYIDGSLGLDQCFQTINCIGKHVEKFATDNGEVLLITCLFVSDKKK